MAADPRLVNWLRDTVAKYELDLVAVFRKHGTNASWPIQANDPDELEKRLTEGGHFLPLPRSQRLLRTSSRSRSSTSCSHRPVSYEVRKPSGEPSAATPTSSSAAVRSEGGITRLTSRSRAATRPVGRPKAESRCTPAIRTSGTRRFSGLAPSVPSRTTQATLTSSASTPSMSRSPVVSATWSF